MLTITIAPPDHCRRLESCLRTLLPHAPSGYARKLIKSGAATLNGSTGKADTFLSVGDTITLKESSTTISYLTEERPSLDLLYEDSQLAIVNKPPGLAMHRTAECEDNLVEVGQDYLTQRETPCKLYPVNRLDRGTSGTVIMAKSSSSAAIYGRQVKETGLDKLYLTLVHGTPASEGVITLPLDDKESETRYRILLPGSSCSLLAVTPISGRMHQIRRHLNAIGHPVCGDKRYGGGELLDYPGFALHSFRTRITLSDAASLTICAPLPEGLLQLCEATGINRTQLLERVHQLAQLTS